MVKIEIEIKNPFKGMIENRKARKEAIKKIKKMNASEIAQIGLTTTKKVESEKVTEATEKIEQQTKQMSKDDVSKKFGNKIIFAKNERNNFLHADKGNIDEFIKYAKSTKFFVVSKDPKNPKQFRVFHNRATLNGLAIAHAKKNGWEISQ